MEESQENKEEETNDSSKSEDSTGPFRWKSNYLNLTLCPDPIIVSEIKDLLSDKNVRISKVSRMILKDPVTALEILNLANSSSFAGENAKIVAAQTAVVRIGSEELFKQISMLSDRSLEIDASITSEMNHLRSLGRRAAIIAEVLSSNLQKDVMEAAQTCSLLSYYGLMLACQCLKEEYLEISHIKKRSTLNYRLQNKHALDPNKIQLDYFKNKNLPQILFYAFDKELKCKTTAQSSLRFIVESSMELSEAHDENKLEKYKHFHKLPAKSNLRLLKISESQYETIFAEIEEALGISRQPNKDLNSQNDLNNEDTISNTNQEEQNKIKSVEFISNKSPTIVMDRSELVNYFTQTGSAIFIEKANETIEQERSELSPSAGAIVGMLQSICKEATSAKKLIEDLMEVVTEKGPFTRSAVIELTSDKKEAFIHSALGEDFTGMKPFHSISVSDPLSPLSTIRTNVQSYNCKSLTENAVSPFGITSYAISPLRTNSPAQLVFYADCGTERSLPLEARKVFRLAVALLNDALPKLTDLKKITSQS